MRAQNVARKFGAQFAMTPQNFFLEYDPAFLEADVKFGAAFGELGLKSASSAAIFSVRSVMEVCIGITPA